MKLHLTQADGQNLITGYSAQWISVNHQRIKHSLIVMPNTLITDWKIKKFDELNETDFEKMASLKPEVALLDTYLSLTWLRDDLLGGRLDQGGLPRK